MQFYFTSPKEMLYLNMLLVRNHVNSCYVLLFASSLHRVCTASGRSEVGSRGINFNSFIVFSLKSY